MDSQSLLPDGVNRIWDIGDSLWKRGDSIYLSSTGAARAWVCRDFPVQTLVILPDQRQAGEFILNFRALFPEESVFPLHELPLSIQSLKEKSHYIRRGEELNRWRAQKGVLVTSPGGLMGDFLMGDCAMRLFKGFQPGRDILAEWLTNNGYMRSDLVWAPGQYVVRGGIMDIFDPAYRMPLRIEFFDEEIENLRLFSPAKQTSSVEVEEFSLHGISDSARAELSDMFLPDMRVVIFDPDQVSRQAESYRWLWDGLRAEASLPDLRSWDDVYLLFSSYPKLRIESTVSSIQKRIFQIDLLPAFRGHVEEARQALSDWAKRGYSIKLFSKMGQGGQLKGIDGTRLVQGHLTGGFVDHLAREVVVSDLEIFGATYSELDHSWQKIPREWSDRLSPGQWVVHEDYGIARFRGLEQIKSGGEVTDSLVLEFAQGQRLLVPIHQIEKISDYQGVPGGEMEPDSLRSRRWRTAVENAKKRAQEEADKLISLYAKRELIKGLAFDPDDDYSKAFAAAFPYIETVDQLRAIEDIRADMEKDIPMDRLVIGDVGYGKTEVAMRAVFKAVESGKQVAVLVPTTVLAQQHYATFMARFSGFPITIEVLSRFVSPRKQKNIVENISSGRVDVVIGTHRMLRKDLKFRDLGLLVIDEEHRFGVMHKERLREDRENLDTLILTATPIPRTLSMSLRGLRDISVISTPPRNRVPVVTVVGPWQEYMVTRAIARELNRGGQVYFVRNRVKGLESRAVCLKRMFPDAEIRVAHGQMKESLLEKNMKDFHEGIVDILVCTTIVESGLDVPRANTLIVDDAHMLGLAQMHQLRGRVGRREEAAYAYFFYPEKGVTGDALERLEAIASYTGSGSGYDLARRDLQIRGGGELLGTSQHGSGERVGYHFYYKMLHRRIDELRGQLPRQIRVKTEISAGIPPSYIPQEGVRIALYRRILRVSEIDAVERLREEIRDRFGPLPPSVLFMLDVSAVCMGGLLLGILSVDCTSEWTRVYLAGETSCFEQFALKWPVNANMAIGPGGYSGMKILAEYIISNCHADYESYNVKGE